ncbi:GCD complex subunit gcd7 [Coemansia sp. RSA 1813]|nr:GCD complex subunit gcd7 [Coemansia sp. RSA 1646]KAJ1773003.1 GCD complex subunit gcd7 [Coemansia sp. RSA 1843]KAJ2092221.1 GCD complex subunit gcd7 [Coemansia sp. RSA 986]KAJ2211339.1 GCD complex subunit gcd7 [Coemansia sp. RSA 487]KAJ2570306.1 GCD complex subunit gcd7 [Coemansia sp. RSA 1813]
MEISYSSPPSSQPASSPSLSSFSRDVSLPIENFLMQLRRGQITESKCIAKGTAELMRQVVANSRWDDISTLVTLLKLVGKKLLSAQPRELLIVNVVCRIIHIVNEEAASVELVEEPSKRSSAAQSSINSPVKGSETPMMGLGQSAIFAQNLGEQLSNTLSKRTMDMFRLKSSIIQEINDYIDDLEGTEDDIADKAPDYIHSSEVILTCGRSRTVERFLRAAARKRKFHVIVTECAPRYDGHEQAKALKSPNIEVVVIPDSAVFAIMSRVNKVILGTRVVMANGGLIATSGTHMIAAAARHHSTQVVVCAGQYKHSPSFPFDDDRFNTLMSPDGVLPHSDGELVEAAEVANPSYDYVPPELVDILVDNTGSHLPSYLYRLLQENYDSAKDFAWTIYD